jgi:hypothetical protein
MTHTYRYTCISVECHFGTTRSTLAGDTPWDSFFKAQVKAVLIQTAMADLSLRPYIRRFKSDAGCILFGPGQLHRVRRGSAGARRRTAPLRGRCVRCPVSFAEIKWADSPLSGGAIQHRLFTLSVWEHAPTEEQTTVFPANWHTSQAQNGLEFRRNFRPLSDDMHKLSKKWAGKRRQLRLGNPKRYLWSHMK